MGPLGGGAPSSTAERADAGRVPARERAAYALGSLGNNLAYGLLSTYLLVFYTESFGLTAAAAGAVFLIARIWDALDDPLIGHLVDNTRSRWGRFRPYLLVAPIAMGALLVAVFAGPDLDPSARFAWAVATYLAWGIAFTLIDVPFWSLSASITPDPAQRSVLITVARTVATGGIVAASVATLPLVAALGGGDDRRGWRLTAVVVAVLAAGLTLACFAGVRERVAAPQGRRTAPRDVVALFRTNEPLRRVLLSLLASDVLLAVKMTLAYYYLRYNLDAEDLVPAFLGVVAVAMIGGSLLTPPLAARFGKRLVALGALGVSSAAFLGLFGAGFGSAAVVLGLAALAGVADGLADVSRTSLLADTVDHGERRTGVRQEGSVFAANIFKTKLGSAVAGAGSAFALAAVGYVAGAAQDPTTQRGLHAVFSLAPAALAALAAWPLVRYPAAGPPDPGADGAARAKRARPA